MELLVVLAILVLLMAMVAPRILGTQKKADINAAKAQIGLFRGALERYNLDMRDFPSTDQGLHALCEEPGDSNDRGGGSSSRSSDRDSKSDSKGDSKVETRGDVKNDSRADSGQQGDKSEGSNKWDGPYLTSTSVPKDPWGHEYQYEYPPTHGKGDYPDVWSFGPDGEDGTDDDIVSWTDSQKDRDSGGKRDREPARESKSSSASSPSRDKAP